MTSCGRKATLAKPIILTDDLPPATFELIGRITVSFGQLEHLLAVLVKRTLEGATFSEGMAEAEKLRTIANLGKAISEGFARRTMNQAKEAEVDASLEEVGRLYGMRHDVIHAVWARTLDGDEVYSRRGRLPPKLAELHQRTRRVIATLNRLIPPSAL